jgi:hypothetical protein
MDQFRKEATDPLGKFGGCFLSPANKEHVLTFRNIAYDEYTKEQYNLFKKMYTPYTSDKNSKTSNDISLNLNNPFDTKNKQFFACSMIINEKEELESINAYKTQFAILMCNLWAEENGL